MNEQLLKYYNRELTYLRRMGAEFAERYPKIAGRLRLTGETVEDPHVSRLLEGVALLTAQIRQRLDDSFPELTEALLGHLYPDYQAPIPSTAILHLVPQNLSTTGIELAPGTGVEISGGGYKPCQFRTCYPLTLWPVEVAAASFRNAPFKAPPTPWNRTPKGLLRLQLRPQIETVSWATLGIRQLRFFLHGPAPHSHDMYERLCRNLIGIVVCRPGEQQPLLVLEPRHLQPAGFGDDQQVVPWQQRSFAGHRLLVEYFLCPDKFLFIDLVDLPPQIVGIDHELEFCLYFDEGHDELEKQVEAGMFRLGCTPVINLFDTELEPFRLEPTTVEQRLVARHVDAESGELVQLTSVEAWHPAGERVRLTPFYGQTHPAYSEQQLFWQLRREAADWAGGSAEPGIDSWLAIVDRRPGQLPSDEPMQQLTIFCRGLCSNRNLPAKLPWGGGQPDVCIRAAGDYLKQLQLLTPPTQAVRPLLGDASRWQLIAQLTLEQFSGDEGCERLRQLLRLYDFKGSAATSSQIDGIRELRLTTASARVRSAGRIAVVAGTDIEITFARSAFAGSSLFFFAAVLERFFAHFAAINSFTRLSIRRLGDEQIYHRWPARSGSGALL